MNKRQFLKIATAALGLPVVSNLLSCANDKAAVEQIKNWAGNLTYSTGQLTNASTTAEVKQFVTTQKGNFKVLGTRHCFNKIADSTDQFLSLVEAAEDIVIDAEKQTVTVNAGIKYGQLSPYLDSKGFALHNLASLPHISVAGACATATHGSGEKSGNLSTAVVGMELVTPQGDVVTLTKESNPDELNGAIVHLGALGVVSKLTLSVAPTFKMKQYVYQNLPMKSLVDNFDAIQASGYSVSLFTNWQSDDITELWIKRREGDQHSEPEAEWLGAKLATKHMHPIPELSAENCTDQMGILGPWYERMPHFKMGFTPSSGVELQSEFFIPRKHAVEAILAIAKLKEQVGPHLMTSEIRTVAADELWLSPAYQQDVVAIHFTWEQHIPEVMKLIPIVERELAPFGARPHWGKLFTISPQELEKAYPRMADFREMANKYDPQGRLRNDYLKTNIFFS